MHVYLVCAAVDFPSLHCEGPAGSSSTTAPLRRNTVPPQSQLQPHRDDEGITFRSLPRMSLGQFPKHYVFLSMPKNGMRPALIQWLRRPTDRH